MLKIEAQLSALKSYVDCELSTLTSKIDAFSDSLKHALANLQNRESNHANTDRLQQSITSLENELRSKDKIIQSLLETQNTLTNSLSTLKAKQPEPIIDLSHQQQRQHQKYLHQYHHHQQHQMDKQQQSQKQQPSEQFQKSLSSRQQKQQGLGNQKQFILGQDELDTLYVGNLSEDINESDLFELFELHSTNYLRDNCDVQILLSENTGKKRGFAYIKVPRHVSDELLKLHGLGFKGKMLVIEKAKTPPKAKNINGVNQNICPQTQTSQLDSDPESRPLQRIKNSYRNTVINKKGDIALFSDSIPRGMNIKEINRQIQGGRIHVKAFPGAKSTQLNHYVTPTLEEYSYDAAIIHVGINDILRSKHDELHKLPENIIKVANTCQKYNIGKIYISAILPSTRTNINIYDINQKLRDLCMKHKFEFIDHEQITSKFLWNDGIHLLDSGKSILGQNFVNRVSNFFRKNDSFLTDPHFQEIIR